ncbi:hypothetical protein [Bradyrhizobium elkanii]|uniref:hypothetical protein n=1 Tax=Bradyrhizobium elkanii TaxID=29448 RepID=UPI00056E4CDD|nr:hypothetical protein [Bradyrhizobium elkanii]WLA78815.1 hypothetical protein QNJ99_25670 [Bradyrhizobium elkanii]
MTDATTLSGLLTQRDTAGSRYAAAITELQAAYVDLAAIDRVLSSGNPKLCHPVSTFVSHTPEGVPEILRHPTFAADPGDSRWADMVQARVAQLMAGF